MARQRTHQGEGPSQRQLRVGEVIRRRLSEVLARGELHDPALAGMSVTVSEVRCSPDLKIATAFVMPLGGERSEEALEALKRNKAALRHLLARALTLKFSPDLRFQLDASFDRMDDTRRLLADPRVRADIDASPDADERG